MPVAESTGVILDGFDEAAGQLAEEARTDNEALSDRLDLALARIAVLEAELGADGTNPADGLSESALDAVVDEVLDARDVEIDLDARLDAMDSRFDALALGGDGAVDRLATIEAELGGTALADPADGLDDSRVDLLRDDLDAVVDEVVAARDAEIDLDTRLDGFDALFIAWSAAVVLAQQGVTDNLIAIGGLEVEVGDAPSYAVSRIDALADEVGDAPSYAVSRIDANELAIGGLEVEVGDAPSYAVSRIDLLADEVDDNGLAIGGLEVEVGVTASNYGSSRIDTLFAWGNHADEGYLTSFTETDPVAMAALAALDDCPAGYTLVGDICVDDVLGVDEMVKVGDFWIDRYEATVWDTADCTTGTVYGDYNSGDNYGSGFPDDGSWTTELYACSVAGEKPSAFITWYQAQQACALSGKDLCSDEQWQAAAAGTVDPGSDNGATGKCNTADGEPRLGNLAGSAWGEVDSCISSWGAEDMIGNVEEWTSDWWSGGTTWMTSTTQSEEQTPWSSDVDFGNDDRTKNLNSRAWNGAYYEGMPAGALRGGTYDDGTSAGVNAINLNYSPASATSKSGFRCCHR